jgi:hypothetical protein
MASLFDSNWQFIEQLIGKDCASIVAEYTNKHPKPYLYEIVSGRYHLKCSPLGLWYHMSYNPSGRIVLPRCMNTQLLLNSKHCMSLKENLFDYTFFKKNGVTCAVSKWSILFLETHSFHYF